MLAFPLADLARLGHAEAEDPGAATLFIASRIAKRDAS